MDLNGNGRGGKFSSDFPTPLSLQKSYEETERELLRRISDKVLSGLSLSEILESVFSGFEDVLSFDRMAVAFLEEDGKRVVCKFVRTKYNSQVLAEGYALDISATSLGRTLEENTPRVIGDLNFYFLSRRNSHSTQMLLREGLRSSMITPLHSQKKALGFLFFNSRYPNAYGERELKILMELKGALTFAIEKAFYIDQLQKALDSYRELLNFVSHEIKNPISSLITQGRLLEQGFLGEMPDAQRKVVGKMLDKGEYLLGLVRNYLDLSKIEGGMLQAVLVDNVDLMKDVVEEAVSISLPRIQEKGMTFDRIVMGQEYPVKADPYLLKVAIINLLGNGITYGREGGRIDLEITYKADGVAIGVKNEGEGFTEEQRLKLFRKFSRLETGKALGIKGTGLGLYITWWIVQQHNGWIDASSEPGDFARFTFFLPRD